MNPVMTLLHSQQTSEIPVLFLVQPNLTAAARPQDMPDIPMVILVKSRVMVAASLTQASDTRLASSHIHIIAAASPREVLHSLVVIF